MLNASTARWFVGRIEKTRTDAKRAEDAILAELRSLPDYEQNSDKDILEAVDLRAKAQATNDDAETIIGAFDWVYDEEAGENKLKPGSPAA
jgi:hypothetical protein